VNVECSNGPRYEQKITADVVEDRWTILDRGRGGTSLSIPIPAKCVGGWCSGRGCAIAASAKHCRRRPHGPGDDRWNDLISFFIHLSTQITHRRCIIPVICRLTINRPFISNTHIRPVLSRHLLAVWRCWRSSHAFQYQTEGGRWLGGLGQGVLASLGRIE